MICCFDSETNALHWIENKPEMKVCQWDHLSNILASVTYIHCFDILCEDRVEVLFSSFRFFQHLVRYLWKWLQWIDFECHLQQRYHLKCYSFLLRLVVVQASPTWPLKNWIEGMSVKEQEVEWFDCFLPVDIILLSVSKSFLIHFGCKQPFVTSAVCMNIIKVTVAKLNRQSKISNLIWYQWQRRKEQKYLCDWCCSVIHFTNQDVWCFQISVNDWWIKIMKIFHSHCNIKA